MIDGTLNPKGDGMDKTNLYKALSLAKNPGNCKYVQDGKPCCIIAQLFVLEGGTVEEMGEENYPEWSTIRRVYHDQAPPQLTKYPLELLVAMQSNWDRENGVFDSIKSRRDTIKQIIDGWE